MGSCPELGLRCVTLEQRYLGKGFERLLLFPLSFSFVGVVFFLLFFPGKVSLPRVSLFFVLVLLFRVFHDFRIVLSVYAW